MPDLTSPPPFLECALNLQAGSLTVAADFDLRAPWTCLFGASGSGKSTILRALAGLAPCTGSIRLRAGPALLQSSSRIDVPAHRRPFRMSAQKPWLFPGNVRDNLRYGMDAANPSLAEEEILHRFELTALASANVRTLSGGEQQRVSLARTVAAALYARKPVALLLLDEPFTGFDLALRNRLALSLRAWLHERNLPVLSVTHDVPEVILLEAETIRLHAGRITGQGPAREVLASEITLLRRQLAPTEPA